MSNRSPAPLATIVGPTSGHRAPGQGLVEYALILVLIAVVSIALMTTLGSTIGGVFTKVTAALG